MLSAENLAAIRSDGERVLELGRLDRERPVPQYPGWLISDLVSHLGGNHARTTIICREFPTERPSAPRPPQGADVIDGTRTISRRCSSPWKSRTWPPRLGFLAGVDDRSLGEEDGDRDRIASLGCRPGLRRTCSSVALVGGTALDEFGEMWVPRMGEITGVLEVTATDLGESWSFGSGAGWNSQWDRVRSLPPPDVPAITSRVAPSVVRSRGRFGAAAQALGQKRARSATA